MQVLQTQSQSLLVGLGLVALVACCTTTNSNLPDAYWTGDLAAAHAAAVEELAKCTGRPAEACATMERPDFEVREGNQALACLQMSMVRMAQGDPQGAIEWLRPTRDTLDQRYPETLQDQLDLFDLKSKFLDASQSDYRGHDYEHVLVRVLLAINSLLVDKGEPYPYSQQISQRQQEIIESPFAIALDDGEYKPRAGYQRIALGAYIEGLIEESNPRFTSEAKLTYERALSYAPDSAVLKAALERTESGRWADDPSHGAVHVFYLGGRGPVLEQKKAGVANDPEVAAIVLALAVAYRKDQDVQKALQTLVSIAAPYPEAKPVDPSVPSFQVATADGACAAAETLLDLNVVAAQQLEANRKWLLAQTIFRRALKMFSTNKVIDDGMWATATLYAWTASECADTRSWSTLPAQFQVARMTLPPGTHELRLGDSMSAKVNVATGYDTFVVVIQPDLRQPGVVLVDHFSDAESFAAFELEQPIEP